MRLAFDCGNFPRFDQGFQTAQVLSHHEAGILAQNLGQRSAKYACGRLINYDYCDNGSPVRWSIAELNDAINVNLGVRQGTPSDYIGLAIKSNFRVPGYAFAQRANSDPSRTAFPLACDRFKMTHE